MAKTLLYFRRMLGVVAGLICLIGFVDITNIAPSWMLWLYKIQIIPALLSGALLIVGMLIVLTLLFGRVYCSVICPLGILQDVILRLRKWWMRILRKKKRLTMKYSRPFNILRYTVLALVLVPAVIGISAPLLWLDPYSSFGRIASALFRPMVVWINNMVAEPLNAAGNYTLYAVNHLDTGSAVLMFAVVMLVVLIVMVWLRGRLWCNTICPVGSLLGFVARFSLVRVSINHGKCNSCGLCTSSCKAQCIDSKQQSVDTSRCVSCYTCLSSCKKGALSYSANRWRLAKQEHVEKPLISNDIDALSSYGLSRRRFIIGSVITAAAIPASKVLGSGVTEKAVNKVSGNIGDRTMPMPPGAVSREYFTKHCTACQLCVSKCPTQVLQPAFMENGLQGMMQPYMRFRVESFCNFECKQCVDTCPTDALTKLTLEQKKLTRVGIARFRKGRCVVFRNHYDCGACAEHCPTQAVHMVPFEDGLTIPKVEPELCIGCGGCESICPVKPAAIQVYGVERQDLADPPTNDDIEIRKVDDFGF